MHRPVCVDVKAYGLAKIVQPEQRCRHCICSVYCLENPVAFEETVGNAISICIETDDLIVVVDRSRRCGAYAVRIVDVGGESVRCDIVSIAVRRACRIDVEAHSNIPIIHPEQLVGLDPVDCPCVRVVRIDEPAVLAADIDEAETVVDQVCVVRIGPEADGRASKDAIKVPFITIFIEPAAVAAGGFWNNNRVR